MDAKALPHDHNDGAEIARLFDATGDEDFETIASLFKLLSDPTRVKVFWLLCHCEECVIDIAALLDMSSPAVSHHLRALRNGGLVTCRRQGKEVYYRASQSAIASMLHAMIEDALAIACPSDGEGSR